MKFRSLALLLIMAAGAVQAQDAEERQRQRAERVEAQRELEQQRSELREAQRALEAAAREVARLSVSGVGPQIQEIVKEFAATGRRAMLGITIEEGKGGAVVAGVSPGGPWSFQRNDRPSSHPTKLDCLRAKTNRKLI